MSKCNKNQVHFEPKQARFQPIKKAPDLFSQSNESHKYKTVVSNLHVNKIAYEAGRRRERTHNWKWKIVWLRDDLQEGKEDMVSGALKENVIEEGETKENLCV